MSYQEVKKTSKIIKFFILEILECLFIQPNFCEIYLNCLFMLTPSAKFSNKIPYTDLMRLAIKAGNFFYEIVGKYMMEC